MNLWPTRCNCPSQSYQKVVRVLKPSHIVFFVSAHRYPQSRDGSYTLKTHVMAVCTRPMPATLDTRKGSGDSCYYSIVSFSCSCNRLSWLADLRGRSGASVARSAPLWVVLSSRSCQKGLSQNYGSGLISLAQEDSAERRQNAELRLASTGAPRSGT